MSFKDQRIVLHDSNVVQEGLLLVVEERLVNLKGIMEKQLIKMLDKLLSKEILRLLL